MAPTSKKRITVKHKHPNPLFEQWLTDWRDKAIETDSKMQHCFGKALQSLRKYPLPLESGRDCRILQGFGEKLCQMLDKKLAEYKAKHPNADFKKPNLSNSTSTNQSLMKKNLAADSRQKEYVPTWRSGPYAILVTLYEKSLEPQFPGHLLKTDITKYAQHLCDKSFVKPDPGSYYTAWSSMKTLLDKNLVTKHNSPAKFSLTDTGLVLAHKLYKNNLKVNSDDVQHTIVNSSKPSDDVHKDAKIKKNASKLSNNKNKADTESSSSLTASQITPLYSEDQMDTDPTSSSNVAHESETLIFTPHSYEIILLVDKQETAGGEKNIMEDSILAELAQLNVSYEVRHLKVGDYTWVCRQHAANKELVLPYIVERKRMDDFGSSVKDGRFHEQKFRLKQCGIQNLIYLIESYGSNTHTGLPLTTLYQAATNTLIQDGFSVKFTNTLRGTTEYLAALTSIITNIFQNKTVMSCPKENLMPFTTQDDLVPLMTFNEFNKGASKSRNFKVRELFIRQLLQLKGMSIDKALAIVEKYPTPLILQTAFKDDLDGEKLLSAMQHGKLNKKIGPAISKTVNQLYTIRKFN